MPWFVGTTKGQQELFAGAQLRQQGYGVFLPKTYLRVQEGRKIHARARLRFTGYIFVSCERDETGPIASTRGMDDSSGSALLGGAYPVALYGGIIERLRAIEDDELAQATSIRKPVARTDLMPGDLVQIDGDKDHVAYGQRGHYLGTERGVAAVLAGIAVWKVAEADLKRVEIDKERKAA